MTITFKYQNGDQLGPKFKFGVKRFKERQIKAAQSAARRASDEIESEGRANIAAGGNFGSRRWQEGFRAKLSFRSRADMAIRITHDVPYWVVFEEGRIIHGRPLLWIPLPFATEAQGIRARDYPGKLFRVDRAGKAPLLLESGSGRPLYFGKEQVRIPRKWHLRRIVKTVARRMGKYYKEAMKSNG